MPASPIKTLRMKFDPLPLADGYVGWSLVPYVCIRVCQSGLRRWFNVPASAKRITLKMYRTPVRESVRVRSRGMDLMGWHRIGWHDGSCWRRGERIDVSLAHWIGTDGGWLSVEYEEGSQ